MQKIKLSPRLLKVSEMISFANVADIGTDHGKLLIYLAQKGNLKHGIGSDVAIGPANACKKNILAYGESDKIEIRVGDGLETLNLSEADTIVIAGMGGELILHILSKNLDIAKSAKEIILQPMTNIPKLLNGLGELDFCVTEAELVKEKDKLYQIFKVSVGKSELSEIDTIICPAHLKKPSNCLKELIRREIKKCRDKREGILCARETEKTEVLRLDFLIKELEKYETLYCN